MNEREGNEMDDDQSTKERTYEYEMIRKRVMQHLEHGSEKRASIMPGLRSLFMHSGGRLVSGYDAGKAGNEITVEERMMMLRT